MRLAHGRRTLALVAAATALGACAAPAAGREARRSACLKRQYGEYVDSRRDLERRLARAAEQFDPSLEAVAKVALDERVAELDREQRAFEAQLDTAPERLRLDGPVNGWLSLPSPPLEELEKRGLAPRSIVSKHRDWPRLRQLLHGDRLANRPELVEPAVRMLTVARETSRCP